MGAIFIYISSFKLIGLCHGLTLAAFLHIVKTISCTSFLFYIASIIQFFNWYMTGFLIAEQKVLLAIKNSKQKTNYVNKNKGISLSRIYYMFRLMLLAKQQ